MKRVVCLFIFFISIYSVKAQQKALTENGREVLLFENGTWKYSSDSISKTTSVFDSLPLNPKKFAKDPNESFLVKSNVLNIGIYINPGNWTFKPRNDTETKQEYVFVAKKAYAYAVVVTEPTPVDISKMPYIALLMAQRAATNVKQTMAEYRMVNNKKVLCLGFQGTVNSLKIMYLGYYFSNEKGTVQLISYTSQENFLKYKTEMESFLNGLVEL